MNKKIMSFVLAMVLSVGLGSAAFAANYDSSAGYQQANSGTYSWTERTSSSTADNQGGETTSTQTGNGFLIQFGSASDQLSGNLSGIFKYYAGTMIGYMQAGGSYILYDSYGQRGVLSNAGGEHFSLQSWNFRTSDLAKMPGENASVEDWNNYLKSIGFSGEQLRRMKFDEQGNPAGTIYTKMTIDDPDKAEEVDKDKYNEDTDKYYYYSTGEGDDKKYYRIEKTYCHETKDGEESDFTDVSIGDNGIEYQSMNLEFFQLLRETLAQGINFSATLNVGDGATGMTFTAFEDGKARATYCSYDPIQDSSKSNNSDPAFTNPYTGKVDKHPKVRCMSEVLYNSNGLQYGTKTYTFEFDSTTANDKDNKVGVGGHWAASYTFINYDDVTGNRYDTTFNKVGIGDGSFTYAVNGSSKTGNINDLTTRADASKSTSVMYYSANGSRYMSVDHEKNETTYYADNQASVVYNSSGTVIKKYQYTENGVIEAMWASDGTADGNGDKGGTYTVFDYWGRDVATFNDTNGTNFGSHESAKGMLNIANKYKKDLIAGKVTNGSIGTLKSVNWFEEDIRPLLNTAPENRSAAIQKIFDSKSMTTMLNFCNGVSAVATTDVTVATWEDNIPQEAVDASDLKSTKHKTRVADASQAGTTESHTKAKGYTLTTTIKAGGSAAFQTKCNIVTEKETTETTYYNPDPAVKGDMWSADVTDEEVEEQAKKEGIDTSDKSAMAKLKARMKKEKMEAKAEELGINLDELSEQELKDFENGFITKDGKTYAILASSEVNLMDGSGFQQTDGETVLVEITEDMKEAITSSMNETGDRTVMFMGDVRKDTNGVLTMAVNTDYKTSQGAGFVVGDEAVATAMKEIEDTTSQVLSAAAELGIDMSQFEGMSAEELKNSKEFQDACKAVCEKLGLDEDSAWMVENTLMNGGVAFAGQYNLQDNNKSLEDAWRILLNF